ncbi:MAG: septum formation inhibitor Maf [Magnetococcales bacterium]|nr:septum formation inhibitor Maf [Magnetococcales bacterium]
MVPADTLAHNDSPHPGEKPVWHHHRWLNQPLFLASASPRRLELLRQIGIEPMVMATDIDESRQPGESITAFVNRMAENKASRLFTLQPNGSPKDLVIGADTVVVVEDQIFGKPTSPQQATAMLQQLSGRWHLVMTAVAVRRRDRTTCWQRLVVSHVCIKSLSADEITAYVASGEPLDKAGAYAIQGLAACFVTQLHGSYSGVVGLPLAETIELLLSASNAS